MAESLARPLPPLIAVVDALTWREGGIRHPHRYWFWRRVQGFERSGLLTIAADETRGKAWRSADWSELFPANGIDPGDGYAPLHETSRD